MKKQPEFPQQITLISHRFESLHRVTLAEPGVLGSIDPPVCGSCHHFEAGLCRAHRTNVAAKDTSCTQHPFQPGHEELVTLAAKMRRWSGRAHLVAQMGRDFHEASETDVAYLGAAEKGERPGVVLRSSEPVPQVPRVVRQQTGLGDHPAVVWLDPDTKVVAVNKLPALEF